MARKKITSLLGTDAEYSKEFSDKPKISAPQPTRTGPAQTTKSQPKEAVPKAAEPKPEQKPAKSVVTSQSETPKKSKNKPTTTATDETRAVHVRAAPKVSHEQGLNKLQAAGLPISDVVRLAGKRAIGKFSLHSKYVAPDDAERLPSDLSFRTMKTLSAKTLDALRDQADPLRLRSDAAVIQGQLEPLFWQELDAVIKELSKQYS